MKEIEQNEPWPFTLTLPQLGTLLVRCGEIPRARDLSRATAALVTHEAAEALASRYPADVVADLAKALATDGGDSELEVRMAQVVSLDEVLSAADQSDPTAVTRKLLLARTRRLTGALRAHEARLVADKAQAENTARKAEEAREAESQSREKLHAELQELRHAQETTQRKLEDEQRARATDEAVAKRRRIRDWLLAAHGAGLLLALVMQTWPIAVGMTVAALLLWERSHDWVSGRVSGRSALPRLVVGLAPDAAGLIAVVLPALGR
jgi:hypothetical protein